MVSRAFAIAVLSLIPSSVAIAEGEKKGAEDFEKQARELRTKALNSATPKVIIPRPPDIPERSRFPWKMNIVTALFYAGEGGSKASAWDSDWVHNFGGFDNPDPAARRDFCPAAFIPRQNPFYFALPYNDVAGGRHKPEAKKVIPWFTQTFERDGKSVCHNRWIAIRKNNRVCYAQWSDVGPHRSDHWQYVFGNERPKLNANHRAGLSVSPAVRDYLGLTDTDIADWKFLEAHDIPIGPWARFGEENDVLRRILGKRSPDMPFVKQR